MAKFITKKSLPPSREFCLISLSEKYWWLQAIADPPGLKKFHLEPQNIVRILLFIEYRVKPKDCAELSGTWLELNRDYCVTWNPGKVTWFEAKGALF